MTKKTAEWLVPVVFGLLLLLAALILGSSHDTSAPQFNDPDNCSQYC